MNNGSSEHGQQQHRGVFDVNEDAALAALGLTWGDTYDQIWVMDGQWGAHHKDAPGDEAVTGGTPDELNRAIRADWARRSAL